jgi:flagellin
MVDRLNNSTGVLDALRYLQTSSRDLSSAESRLASGRKVNNARDNVPAYHSAEIMRGQQSSLSAVTLSLGRAESISETAISAAEQISKLLIEMRSTAGAAMGEDLSPQQRQAYMTQFADQRAALERFVHAASFDDANILNGSKPNGVTFIADSDATQTVSLAGRNFLPGQSVVTVGAVYDLASPANARAAQDALAQSIANVGDQLNEMVAERKRIEAQKGFVTRLADALAAGVGRMVDTDLAVESALIQALQVKQELSAQSVGIVNAAPQTLLSLFRA